MTAALLAAGAALGAPARDASPLQLSDGQPIQLEARSSDFDYKNNTLVFHGVRIAQVADYSKAVSDVKKGGYLKVLLQRGRTSMFVALSLE